MEAAVVPVIRRNERLIIMGNNVDLDERIRSYPRLLSSCPLAPRTCIHPADRKKNYAQARIRGASRMSSRSPGAWCVLVTFRRRAIAVAGNFFHPALVFASNGLANATSVTYRLFLSLFNLPYNGIRDGKFYFVDESRNQIREEIRSSTR